MTISPKRDPCKKEAEICREKHEKTVDLGFLLCYIMFYLSTERFLFARFFAESPD